KQQPRRRCSASNAAQEGLPQLLQRGPRKVVSSAASFVEGREGDFMGGGFTNASAIMPFLALPSPVLWSYFVFGVVLAVGLIAISLRGGWQKARSVDKLLLLAPLF